MQLAGKVNGVDIILNWVRDGIYSTTIPRNLTGVYIVQLFFIGDGAWDVNYSNVFVRIDFQNIRIDFLDTSYVWEEGKDDSFGYRQITDYDYAWDEITVDSFISKELLPQFSYLEVL